MLESSGMPYMLTGSYASAVHGTPRATQDIDTSYYVGHEAALDALARRGQFNVIDFATALRTS